LIVTLTADIARSMIRVAWEVRSRDAEGRHEGGEHEGEDMRAEGMKTEGVGAYIRRRAATFWGCQFVFVSL